jgi:hypothetical protein
MRTILTLLGQPLPEQESTSGLKPQPHHRPEDKTTSPDPTAEFRATEKRDIAVDLAGLEPPPPAAERPPPSDSPNPATEVVAVRPSPGNPIGAGSLAQSTWALDLRLGGNHRHRHARSRPRQSSQGSLRSRRPRGRGRFQSAPGGAGNASVRQGHHRRNPARLLARRNQEARPQDGRGDHRARLADAGRGVAVLAAQARKRIVDCLRWDEGSYSFTPGDTFGDRVIEHDLDVAKSVFLGLYRSATPETLVSRFDQSGACPVQLTHRFDRYKSSSRRPSAATFRAIIADAPTIGALSLREDAHVIMAEIEALLETGLADLGEPMEESDPRRAASNPPSPSKSWGPSSTSASRPSSRTRRA